MSPLSGLLAVPVGAWPGVVGREAVRRSAASVGLRTHIDFCIVASVSGPWQIEIEPEVRQWLELLSDAQYDKVERAADMLAAQPTTLAEPYFRHLGGKVRELRFTTDGNSVRVTYWLAPDRRIVLLTVFRKTRQREAAEVERAQQAQKACEADHGSAEHRYDRIKEESP